MRSNPVFLSALGLALAMPACVDVDEDDAAAELGRSDSELAASTPGATLAATVMLGIFPAAGGTGSACSATVITDHWLLTSGHCLGQPADARLMVWIADQTGASNTLLYNDTFEWFRHPGYFELFGDPIISNDLGLIYLRDGGMAGFAPRGRFFSDPVGHPWYGGYYINGWIEGFGKGSNGSGGCDGAPGTLRRNQRMPAGSSSLVAISAANLSCGGDSGGPWMFNLNDAGWIMVQYAVNHGHGSWGGDVGGNWDELYDTAAALPSALPWMETTMRNRMGGPVRLDVTERVATSYLYRSYREQPMATLTASVTGTGSLTTSPSTTWCDGPTCRFYFLPGTSAQVFASPGAGWRFSQWTSCPSPSGSTCNVYMGANASVGAKFVRDLSCHVDSACRSACVADCAGIHGCAAMCAADCTVCN